MDGYSGGGVRKRVGKCILLDAIRKMRDAPVGHSPSIRVSMKGFKLSLKQSKNE